MRFTNGLQNWTLLILRMATLIQAEIPPREFALAETFQTCAEATVECEQLVKQPDATVMPLVWVRNTRPDAFEAALDDDPTVATYTQLADTTTEWLYEMHWSANIELVCQFFTMDCAMILDASGSAAGWDLRVLFPDREDVRTTTEFCEAHNLTFTIHSIRQLDGTARQGQARFGLTADQHEALIHAYEQGYFAVPRDVDLEAVADGMEISHQALSERLRRAHQALIGETLLAKSDSPQQSGTDDDDSDDSSVPPGAS
jgi:predicted DNA binding protein